MYQQGSAAGVKLCKSENCAKRRVRVERVHLFNQRILQLLELVLIVLIVLIETQLQLHKPRVKHINAKMEVIRTHSAQ